MGHNWFDKCLQQCWKLSILLLIVAVAAERSISVFVELEPAQRT